MDDMLSALFYLKKKSQVHMPGFLSLDEQTLFSFRSSLATPNFFALYLLILFFKFNV